MSNNSKFAPDGVQMVCALLRVDDTFYCESVPSNLMGDDQRDALARRRVPNLLTVHTFIWSNLTRRRSTNNCPLLLVP